MCNSVGLNVAQGATSIYIVRLEKDRHIGIFYQNNTTKKAHLYR